MKNIKITDLVLYSCCLYGLKPLSASKYSVQNLLGLLKPSKFNMSWIFSFGQSVLPFATRSLQLHYTSS